ncbi:ABC transporter permease [Phreatobacter sp. AB_2022a]|uniref:ABC transporter permease n=1 Tax=Phreatobacter sp. AB_2022a TaxID=3003134 RepID=UPI00228728F6|nr:ABC transporter permease [Phreatobacter sp. AB_2022a]MCZ0733736.1 ABC transporter permease [Phreatobacter sp. AB_2022a]
MGAYLVKRILTMIPTLIGVAVLIFLMLRVVPGDIVELKMRGDGGAPTVEQVEAERVRLGLDKPLYQQFTGWMIGLATFDLGNSMWTEQPVTQEIAGRLGLTLQVAIMATIIAILIAVPLGTLSALYKDSWVDQAIRIFTIGGLAIPSFWLGMMIIVGLLFAFNWIPPMQYVPIWQDPFANIAQLIWPALAVGYRFSAVLARMVRSSIVEVMREDYIRTARAKGVYERLVIGRHALRNAMLPAVTVIGLEFAFLIGGLVVTEQVFNLNGLGRLFVQAVTRSDFTMVQGIVMLIALVFIVTNLIVDLAYAWLDPRIRFGGK